jgi:phage FluMu gp28-like protein
MKKDTNYLASVEKAIAEKYGKDTVQDFRSEWETEKEKKYLRELKNARKKTSDPKNKQTCRPKDDRSCGVCKTYSFSRSDDLYINGATLIL